MAKEWTRENIFVCVNFRIVALISMVNQFVLVSLCVCLSIYVCVDVLSIDYVRLNCIFVALHTGRANYGSATAAAAEQVASCNCGSGSGSGAALSC